MGTVHEKTNLKKKKRFQNDVILRLIAWTLMDSAIYAKSLNTTKNFKYTHRHNSESKSGWFRIEIYRMS